MEKLEKEKLKQKIKSWATNKNFDFAKELTRTEIFEKFGNKKEVIAILPVEILHIFDTDDRNVYCGKGYFIDHMANHHPEVDLNYYETIQDILDEHKEIYFDKKNESVVFCQINSSGKKDFLVLKKDNNERIVFYKTFYYGNKFPKKLHKIEINREISVEGGRFSINHLENQDSAASISARTDTGNNLQRSNSPVNSKISDYEKLEDLDSIRDATAAKIPNPYTFEYDGLTYIPVRSLSEDEKALINNRTPKDYWKNSIIEKPKNGENYSIENFRKKNRGQNADLFYCIERGKFFTPVENGIINLNEGSIDGHFREELNSFYNNQNTQEVIKNHRPLVFNEKEDISLMQNIISVLKESEVFYKHNETLGDVRVKFGNIKHGGVSHIIKRRMDKLIKHEGFSYDYAVKETSAILFSSLQNISEAPAIKESDGRYAIYKEGIKTSIGKDKNGRYVVTGFDFNDTKQEAADAIKSVNALYGYTPEFLEIYAQVGAAYASLENNVTQQNSPVNSKISDYEKLLYSSAEIDVNGKVRHCKNGLMKGFENAVSLLDTTFAENSRLKDENSKLKSRIYSIFIHKNNANLNNEMDSLSAEDINLKNVFIRISEKTPFIYQKLGLKDLPIYAYRQKLARALFLDKECYGERRTHGHKNEFSTEEMKRVFEKINNPRYIFNSKQNFYDSGKLTLIGIYDEFDKYRNPMMITVCFDKNTEEAQWVTSIYGKNKEVIVNDWTKKGYLLYKNDLEIEKAPEEMVTLYMRISKSSNAYGDKVLLKSQIVNDKISDYEKLLYTSAEIDVNGKVRHCKNGLMKGFENAVSLLDSTFAENSRLRDENSKLKSRIYSIYSECEKLSKDNEELKKQALKNKIRPMGM